MKKFQKILSLILCGVLAGGTVLSASCGSKDGGKNKGENPNRTELTVEGTVHGGKVVQTSDYIVKDGKTDYKVVVSDTATPEELKAYGVLVAFFYEATGINLQSVKDTEMEWSENSKIISIGETDFAKQANVSYEYQETDPDGFAIKTVGKSVFLLGEFHGIRYAAYELLKYWLNFEYYYEYCYSLDKDVTELKFYEMDVTEVPDIAYRSGYVLGISGTSTDVYFQHGIRITGTAPMFGYGKKMHNSLLYVPYEEYGKDHPEWFMDKIDMQTSKPYQLCYSKGDEYLDIAFEHLKEVVLASPTYDLFTFQIEDNGQWCECADCTAAEAKYGANSGVYVLFLNKLAKKMGEWVEAEKIDRNADGKNDPLELIGMAYHETEASPTVYNEETGKYEATSDEMYFEPNLNMWYAPHNCEYMIAFDEEGNENEKKNLASWGMLSNKLYMWTYNQAAFAYYWMFYDNFGSMQRNYQLLVQHDTYSITDQGQWNNTTSTGFNTLRLYLASELMWNCQMDYAAATDNFFKNYFGPAAEPMRTIFDSLRSRYTILRKQKVISFQTVKWTDPKIYPEGFVKTMLGYIDEAYKAIEPLKETDPSRYDQIYDHICLESILFRYLQITNSINNYSSLEQLAMKQSVKDDVTRLGITRYTEGGLVETLWTQWGLE